jgi:hypothetical protein
MRSDRESLSAGEVTRTLAQDQGVRAHLLMHLWEVAESPARVDVVRHRLEGTKTLEEFIQVLQSVVGQGR